MCVLFVHHQHNHNQHTLVLGSVMEFWLVVRLCSGYGGNVGIVFFVLVVEVLKVVIIVVEVLMVVRVGLVGWVS